MVVLLGLKGQGEGMASRTQERVVGEAVLIEVVRHRQGRAGLKRSQEEERSPPLLHLPLRLPQVQGKSAW